MNPTSGNDLWERAAAAARQRTQPVPPVPHSPPTGFAAKLAARWAELRQNETFRLWCRWSFRAAVAGVVVACIMALWPPPRPSNEAAPLRVPRVEVPSFPAP